MFKRTVLALALMPSLLSAQALKSPQGLSDSAAILYRQLMEVLPRYNAAREAMDADQNARQRQAFEALDTTAVGPFTIIAADKESREAFEAFRRGLQRRADMFEGVTRRTTLLVEYGRPVPMFRYMGSSGVAVYIPRYGRDQDKSVDEIMNSALVQLLPAPVVTWLSDGAWHRQSKMLSKREFTLADSKVVQECNAGQIQGCVDALMLGDTVRGNWYTTEQIRNYVARTGANSWQRTQCRKTGDRQVCLAALKMWGGIEPPISPTVRGDLFFYALKKGGRGAVARMQQAGSAADALTAASKQDLPSLVREWRAQLNQAFDSSRRLDASVGLSALFWTGVFLALAMRSTRRRTR